ncbi:hypothetical protein N802_12440 [Knoellia sinensis KCTC 19936]|uniref:SGNH hydrolase-type esterase domain-containing protein n=1 Tax=Knoellia sinensis KCTC 19936 TaxID=1385520 RepID=A0A0A0JB71_9MICO|nr:hypothetical protein [Knoellia sinensis]KGN34398.1 hypothetical protein N802_12440 [Knoellia sinensis KCTC 19936]
MSPRAAWRDPRLWAGDRVHPSPIGHQRLATQVAHLLGLHTPAPRAPELEAAPQPSKWAQAVADEIEWWREHAAPHIARWATGASRRELVVPKWSVPVRPASTFPWLDVAPTERSATI